MAKTNRPKSGAPARLRPLPELMPGPLPDASLALRSLEWDPLEADFFAREADLYRVIPVETFDDLNAEARSTVVIPAGVRRYRR